jgi:Protein of unknown function (DUF742)
VTNPERASGLQDGRVVPVFALTKGRAHTEGQDMPIEALVTVSEHGARLARSLDFEYRAIVRLGRARPISVIEIAAALGVPVGVARVLVSDLADAGYLVVHAPPPAAAGQGPDRALLERLLDGLRAL